MPGPQISMSVSPPTISERMVSEYDPMLSPPSSAPMLDRNEAAQNTGEAEFTESELLDYINRLVQSGEYISRK